MTTVRRILFVVCMTLLPVLRYPQAFLSYTNPRLLEQRYAASQYVVGEASVHKIDDDTLYAYAGYAYAQGEDPTTINFEHPPLAKYFFGLSYHVFGNAVTLNLLLFALMLWWCLLIAQKTLHTQSLAVMAVLLIGLQPLIHDHASRALLDFPQAVAVVGFFAALFSRSKHAYQWAGIALGVFCGIKYPFPVIGLLVGLLLMWSVWQQEWKRAVISACIAVSVYILAYSVYFVHHPNPLDFIRFEWYRFRWWVNSRDIPHFLIFSTLFTGRFKGWWQGNVYEHAWGWSPVWPISFVLQLVGGWFLKSTYKRFPEITLLFVYCQALLLLYAFGSASYARYLLPLLPFWIIGGLWTLEQAFTTFQKKRLVPNTRRGSKKKRG